MKHLLPVLFLLFSIAASGQTTLTFCVEVDTNGKCTKHTNEFDVTAEGGTISLLLQTSTAFDTEKVRFKIFFVDASGNEKQINTLEQTVNKGWNYVWKDVVFYDAGMYKIKVYATDPQERFLCSEILKIFTQ